MIYYLLSKNLTNLLKQYYYSSISKSIVILIEEIEAILYLNFSTDDFFAFVRSCYNKQANKSRL